VQQRQIRARVAAFVPHAAGVDVKTEEEAAAAAAPDCAAAPSAELGAAPPQLVWPARPPSASHSSNPFQRKANARAQSELNLGHRCARAQAAAAARQRQNEEARRQEVIQLNMLKNEQRDREDAADEEQVRESQSRSSCERREIGEKAAGRACQLVASWLPTITADLTRARTSACLPVVLPSFSLAAPCDAGAARRDAHSRG